MSGKKEILIVEDNDDLRGMFARVLTIAGYETHEARAGYEALLVLESRRPDLVVLDLGLPGIDGFAVQREIAANAFLRHIPVVVVTASTDDLSSLNVACVLRKPVTPDQLIKVVGQCLAAGAPKGTNT